jgi:aryl-alcohol dehydrogenase-like predicted oxidoreductase
MYGAGVSEEVLGKALGTRRKEVYIADKVSPENCAPDRVRRSCEASLRRLGTDRIDLYQVHWPSRSVPFEDTWAALADLRDEGKIRQIGVSNFGPRDLGNWGARENAVSDQVGYNLLFRAAEYEVIPACRERDVSVLAYMPLMQGLLTGRYASIEDIPMLRRRTRHFSRHRDGTRHGEEGHENLLMDTVADLRDFAAAVGLTVEGMALSWLAAQPGVASIILGARNPSQLLGNLRGLADIGPAAVAQLNELTYPLKRVLGPNCDMWQTAENSRIR